MDQNAASDCRKTPRAVGRFEAYHMVSLLQGCSVSTERGQGSKENRAESLAAQCETGGYIYWKAHGIRNFIDEMCAFPNAAHDDQVVAVCAAFRTLARRVSFTMLAA